MNLWLKSGFRKALGTWIIGSASGLGGMCTRRAGCTLTGGGPRPLLGRLLVLLGKA